MTTLTLLCSAPLEWITLLKRIENISLGTPILAGGAWRDMLNDKPIKDLDVFVGNFPNAKSMLEAGAFTTDDGWTCEKYLGQEYCANMPDVAEVLLFVQWEEDSFGLKLPVGTPVNVILTETDMGWANLDRFDFGICQIGSDAKGEVRCSQLWQHDYLNQRFTCTETETKQIKRSKRRATRLLAKYSDWSFVYPEVAS